MSDLISSGEELVKARATQALRLGNLYKDEASGLLWSINHEQPLAWSKDPEVQAAFLKGFEEGREILHLSSAVRAVAS